LRGILKKNSADPVTIHRVPWELEYRSKREKPFLKQLPHLRGRRLQQCKNNAHEREHPVKLIWAGPYEM
jgi:hypothetical protein